MSVCPKTCRPYCSAHDEWLSMKLCMYVGYHYANNVSHFSGDQVTQLNLKNVLWYYLHCFTDMTLHSRDAVTVYAAVATRSRADCSSMEDRRPTIKWSCQPKHNPSFTCLLLCLNAKISKYISGKVIMTSFFIVYTIIIIMTCYVFSVASYGCEISTYSVRVIRVPRSCARRKAAGWLTV